MSVMFNREVDFVCVIWFKCGGNHDVIMSNRHKLHRQVCLTCNCGMHAVYCPNDLTQSRPLLTRVMHQVHILIPSQYTCHKMTVMAEQGRYYIRRPCSGPFFTSSGKIHRVVSQYYCEIQICCCCGWY